MQGRVFGTGALSGILAAVLGSSVGRKAKKVMAIMQQAGSMPDGAQKAALFQQAGALQKSMAATGRITIVLMIIALVTMSVGHYVG
jgi:hypothetical protein